MEFISVISLSVLKLIGVIGFLFRNSNQRWRKKKEVAGNKKENTLCFRKRLRHHEKVYLTRGRYLRFPGFTRIFLIRRNMRNRAPTLLNLVPTPVFDIIFNGH